MNFKHDSLMEATYSMVTFRSMVSGLDLDDLSHITVTINKERECYTREELDFFYSIMAARIMELRKELRKK